MSKANRNDPCPCGSGKKYKKCCMLKERDLAAVRAGNREIVQEAINWVSLKHGPAMNHWVESSWFADIDAMQRQGIATADQSIKNIHDTNLLEFMISEGEFTEGDGSDARRVIEMVLATVENLTDSQREYLEQIPSRPLRMYEVTETTPGESFVLQAWPAKKGGESFSIEDKWISRQLDVGDTVGLRLLQTGGVWETSGAVYHIPAEYLGDLQAVLDEAGEKGYSAALVRFWLELVAAHV